ncbi:probable beta-arrestin [Limulus polyphemus]|uniref:Probable beta-arrestin n=1 Tax=Limulus polyphemus TaxID=6850 RepID=A0ABM1BWH9_LIMPO|nr:probable beta-arrestin [Limulus polyphemus]
MSLRCIHYSPTGNFNSLTHPTASLRKTFSFSPGRLDVEVMLDREVYDQGDTLRVHVTVNNNSIKTVQRIKLYVIQHVFVCMFTNGHFKNVVGNAETDKKHPIPAGASISRDFAIKLMNYLKYPVALAVESGLQEDNLILASTTTSAGPKEKTPYGVIVSYEVKVKVILGCIDRSIVLRLPFQILTFRPLDDQTKSSFDEGLTSQQKTISIDLVEVDPVVAEQITKLGSLNTWTCTGSEQREKGSSNC